MTLERQFAVMDAMGDVFHVMIGYRHQCTCDQLAKGPLSSPSASAMHHHHHHQQQQQHGAQSPTATAGSSYLASPQSSPVHCDTTSMQSSRATSALSLGGTGSGNSPERRDGLSVNVSEANHPSSLILPLCRHIIFVLTRVLKVSRESRYMVQRELQAPDLMDIYAHAPPNPWNSVSSVMNTIIEEVTKRAARDTSFSNRSSSKLQRSSSNSALLGTNGTAGTATKLGKDSLEGLLSLGGMNSHDDMDMWSDHEMDDAASGANLGGSFTDLMDIFGGGGGGAGKHSTPATSSECNICFEPFGHERLTYCIAKCGNNFHQVDMAYSSACLDMLICVPVESHTHARLHVCVLLDLLLAVGISLQQSRGCHVSAVSSPLAGH